jgi:hypothetical protein
MEDEERRMAYELEKDLLRRSPALGSINASQGSMDESATIDAADPEYAWTGVGGTGVSRVYFSGMGKRMDKLVRHQQQQQDKVCLS